MTVTDAAAAIEVTRQTVSEWLNHHPGFQAALNRRRQELWVGMTDALRNLLPQVVEVLKHELEGEARLQAAVHLLKCCGLYNGIPAPQGPTEPEDADIAMRRRNFDRMLAALASDPPLVS
jgi:hypothetical protein